MKKMFAIVVLLISQLSFASDLRVSPRELYSFYNRVYFVAGIITVPSLYAAAIAGSELDKNPNNDYLKGVQTIGYCVVGLSILTGAYSLKKIHEYKRLLQDESDSLPR